MAKGQRLTLLIQKGNSLDQILKLEQDRRIMGEQASQDDLALLL